MSPCPSFGPFCFTSCCLVQSDIIFFKFSQRWFMFSDPSVHLFFPPTSASLIAVVVVLVKTLFLCYPCDAHFNKRAEEGWRSDKITGLQPYRSKIARAFWCLNVCCIVLFDMSNISVYRLIFPFCCNLKNKSFLTSYMLCLTIAIEPLCFSVPFQNTNLLLHASGLVSVL